MSEKKEVLLEVNGLVIKTDSVYKITNKPDGSAPTGFIKEGTTKLPSEGIGNTVPCRYIITNKAKKTGVFDTGLYEESPMYGTMDRSVVSTKVRKLKEAIVEPYERKYGKGKLDHSNDEFWTEFGVDLFEGRYFVTSKPDDLLELYIAMIGYELTPKEQIGNPAFSESDFCIEDKEKVQSIKSERANNMVNAITNFGSLVKTDKNTLLNILRYMNVIGVSDDVDPDTLNGLFFEWLNKETDNPEKFDNVFQLTNNEETKDIVNLYAIISKLAAKKVIDRVSGMYVYKGKDLGLDLKTVAKNLNSDKELEDIKIEFIEA